MGKIAFLFPGQGSQTPGMGRELYECSPAARAVFDQAESLRPGTIEQCFSAQEAELAQTENTQPCLFCTELAAAASLEGAGIRPQLLAGFSLGELAALTFAGAMTFAQGFTLVCKRGELMAQASRQVQAGMMAVLKLEDEVVRSLCREFEQVYPVNFNGPGQVTVAGRMQELEGLKQRVKELGGRAVPLKVSGGFHSPFLAQAAQDFSRVLETVSFGTPRLPVYSNVHALPYDGYDIPHLLAKQMCSPVLWGESITRMAAQGTDTFIEVGPGKVLSGLVSRIVPQVQVLGAEDRESLIQTVKGVKADA